MPEKCTLSILNILGTIVLKEDIIYEANTIINISDLSDGVYICLVKTKNQYKTKLFVVEKTLKN